MLLAVPQSDAVTSSCLADDIVAGGDNYDDDFEEDSEAEVSSELLTMFCLLIWPCVLLNGREDISANSQNLYNDPVFGKSTFFAYIYCGDAPSKYRQSNVDA